MQPVPQLSEEEIQEGFQLAKNSPRKRFPKILHKPGDYHNRVFNFLMKGTYMQPHRHPSEEKIEKMSLVKGSFALIFFDDNGEITKRSVLQKKGETYIEVPAFTWHTYIMLTEQVLVYETMNGKYQPKTWKELANWAPDEESLQASDYEKKLCEKSVDQS